MTENEIHFRNTDDCIKKIKSIRTMYRDTAPSYVALSDSIQALEEIQQYRAIGTIEEFRKLRKMFGDDFPEMSEVVKRILKEYPEYQSIGTVDEFKTLKEKNVAKRPRFYAHNYYCTECGNLVGNNEFEWQRFLYCDKCGQKLD